MTWSRLTSSFGPHAIGAIAGVGPAALILGYYTLTGGPIMPGLLTIVAAAIAAGWLIGPRVGGSLRVDLVGLVSYLVTGYLLHSAIALVITIWEGISSDATAGSLPVLDAVAVRVTVTLVYFPVGVVFLSPIALAWMLTVRVIRGRTEP